MENKKMKLIPKYKAGKDMNCKNCDFVCDTPLGSYCTLTNIAVEITECHYDDEIKKTSR